MGLKEDWVGGLGFEFERGAYGWDFWGWSDYCFWEEFPVISLGYFINLRNYVDNLLLIYSYFSLKIAVDSLLLS